MRPHTIDDVRGDLEWLYWNEIEGLTHAQIAARVGLDRSQVSRRLARARRYRQEQERAEKRIEERANGNNLDRFDHEYMELSTNPSGLHPACTPDGESSEDHGTFHVGGQVRSLRFGIKGKLYETRQAQPTSYNPPEGLKGGVDH